MNKLGRKQTSSNADWAEAWSDIENRITRQEIEDVTERTTEKIYAETKGKNAGYAWSGGKDSIVLAKLCEDAGVKKCVLGRCDLEYPAFMAWVMDNHPEGLQTYNVGLDLDWLARNQQYLFPPLTYHYSRVIQIPAQDSFYKDNALDMILLGRRLADGNYVGAGTNLYTDRKGRTKYNPLSDWTHEQVLGFIHYNALPMPPIYAWKDGWKIGTHPWYTRPYAQNVEAGWREVYNIDPAIVAAAAQKIDSAACFMQGVDE